MAFFGLFGKEKKETLDKGLEKTKESVLSKISHAIAGKSTVDDDVLDNLEEALITSDVGVETTLRIIERIHKHSVGVSGRFRAIAVTNNIAIDIILIIPLQSIVHSVCQKHFPVTRLIGTGNGGY